MLFQEIAVSLPANNSTTMTFMKKIHLIGILALLTLSSYAGGEKTKVDAAKVEKITFEGDRIVVHYNDGTTADTSFEMGTVIIDFSTLTSIEERVAVTSRQGLEGKAVYDLKGQKVGDSIARMQKGVYVVNGQKIVIK